MNLRSTTITAGLAALSLAVSAGPAFAQGGGGGGGINNTVVSTSGTLPAPTSGGGSNSGSGGSGRPATCQAVGVDPVTGSILMTCTQARV
ncbi:MAG: hypothetical protein QOC55_1437 [Thermoleophilaceae bacterium]|jgi:hypothetical protein|nr:hypothetical protein [Thermoleophilaceae bacterium]